MSGSEQFRAEASKARRLLNDEYFQTVTHEMEVTAMDIAVVGATPEQRADARIEVLMIRKMRAYLQTIADMVEDAALAEAHARANE